MFCFNQKTNVFIAENVSAVFLYSHNTPETARFEANNAFSAPALMLLPGATPADVHDVIQETEYQVLPGSNDLSVAVTHPFVNVDDVVFCGQEHVSSEDVITVKNNLAEEECPMFLFRKHIPSGFYVTVCNRDYFLYAPDHKLCVYRKYCCSVKGFIPSGMKLKIKVQNFKL